MRILLLGNNRVAWELARWLKEQGEEFAGLVLHPEGKRKFGDEIIAATGVPPERVVDGARLREPETLEAVRALGADIGVSAFFGYVLKQPFLDLLPKGCVNIHPSLLPYNRGSYPNVWSIVEGTPAGATLHYIDEGLDTGDIIAQREVPVEPVDTGATLYDKLEQACVEVFQEAWPLVRRGEAPRVPQPAEGGTAHRMRDVEQIDCIDLARRYTARELIDILRARTFPPFPGAYFMHEGRKVYLRLQLVPEEELNR